MKKNHKKTINKSLPGIGIVAALRETNLVRFDFQATDFRLARFAKRLPFTASAVERCPTSWKNAVWRKKQISSLRSFQFNGPMDPSFGFRRGLEMMEFGWTFFSGELKTGNWRKLCGTCSEVCDFERKI